ncbi:UNVERIFIED_CONTAM: hypothetical protein GTU68_029619 [Idotea baltica]|nr:hypothetical protein [Idotea baltica]
MLHTKAPDIPLDRIHFGVKTCQKLASERLPVLRDTWLPRVSNYALYSDVEDETLGTISLNIPNSERGHCRKTLGIIRRAAQMDIDWLVIADDDTLLSPPRLASLLGPYDPTSSLALGERYAYMIGSGAGFNYLTGGAGMVLSKRTVSLLSKEGACDCPSSETPDDMYLGACLQRQQVPIIHSRRFHQARPDDYAPSLLKDTSPISFHKYWMLDPRQVYSRWLVDPTELRHPQTHQEL